MDSKQFSRRSWGLIFLLFLLLAWLGFALYDAQVVNGAYWAERSKTKITDEEVVAPDRGDILDRYGRVLVSDRVTYQVTLNTSVMGAERNQILTDLIDVARREQVEWTDNLPISTSAPFYYTSDSPFFALSTAEDGTQTRTLTRFGRLAVKMKWIPEIPTDPTQPAELPAAGQLLAQMYKSFDIAAEETDPVQARALAGVLYELYLRSQEIYWETYVFAEDVDIDFISQVKERGLAGVNIDAVTTRQYHTEYAAHLLGRVALMSPKEWDYYQTVDLDGDGEIDYKQNDTVGKEGVEQAFESYLRGKSGKRQVERDTSGKIVNEVWITEPEPGDNIVLTIDIDLQQVVEDTLAEGLPKLASDEVEGAACVVLDVNNGELLASASYPTYNLASYSADYNENASNPLKPFINRAFLGLYAPGSTFKMVTAIAGLEEGIVTPKTIIKDTGRYTYYNKNGPMCWIYRQLGGVHGDQNVTQAIKNSCNIYFFDVGRQVTIDGLQKYASYFGLGEKTGIELPEYTGTMAGPKNEEERAKWQPGSTLSVAIGQENSQFTPLQLANYIATLVNGGTHYSVHLLKNVKSSDFSQVVYTQEAEVLNTIEIQEKNLEAVKMGMLALTTEGSVSYYFKNLDVAVGAKTGSAQVSANTESHAHFVCFAPYDDPQIAIAISVEHGGSGSDVGSIAAKIINYYFSAEETREEILTENTLIR